MSVSFKSFDLEQILSSDDAILFDSSLSLPPFHGRPGARGVHVWKAIIPCEAKTLHHFIFAIALSKHTLSIMTMLGTHILQ